MSALKSFEIDYNSGLPVWIQVKNRIAYLIGTGAYAVGDKLRPCAPWRLTWTLATTP